VKKTPLFISGVLTTFVLIVMAGVLTAFRSVSAEAQPTATGVPTEVPATATVAAPQVVSPEEAAQIAAKLMNQTDVYSVESAVLDGVDVYKVTLSSGDIVYVSPTGDVVQVVPAPRSGGRSGPGPSPSGGSHSESDSHYENDEHEGHDD
jgi:hypothetical protein